MKRHSIILLFAMALSGFIACEKGDVKPNDSNTGLTPEEIAKRNQEKEEEKNKDQNAGWKVVNTADERENIVIPVSINAETVYQTIEGFGASDCWLGEFVGKNYTSKMQMAKLLFSQDTTSDGSLQGIGLSMWRVNLGAGSAEQGEGSKITDVARRAECYLKADGKTYDWSKCKGQQYFMSEAKRYGVEKMLLFSNSPLVFFTDNGLAFSAKGEYANIKDDCYDKFAGYMADVAKHFTESGINIDYISPVNEPQYNWDGTDQEGSGWQNSEITKLVKALDEKLGSLNTKIVIAEAGSWSSTFGNTVKGRDNQINEFFGSGDNSVKDLTHVHKVAAAHSYWEDRSWSELQKIRTSAYNAAQNQGIGLWQTEWSMLGEYSSTDVYPGLEGAMYIDNALYLSRVIYSDLVWANVSSWSYWTVWGQERWNQKNRFYLIKLGADVSDYHDTYDDPTTDRSWAANVNLYVLGNYSRFIRPGYKRVDINCGNDKSFFGTAFVSGDGNTLVAVYTNLTNDKIRVEPTITGFSGNTKFIRFVTDENKRLERTNMSDGNIVIPAKSVATIVYTK